MEGMSVEENTEFKLKKKEIIDQIYIDTIK